MWAPGDVPTRSAILQSIEKMDFPRSTMCREDRPSVSVSVSTSSTPRNVIGININIKIPPLLFFLNHKWNNEDGRDFPRQGKVLRTFLLRGPTQEVTLMLLWHTHVGMAPYISLSFCGFWKVGSDVSIITQQSRCKSQATSVTVMCSVMLFATMNAHHVLYPAFKIIFETFIC